MSNSIVGEDVAMVSGHTDLTKEEWETYYKSKIDICIAEGCSFIMGGAEGADRLTQEYLATFPEVKVTVVDKGTNKNVYCDRYEHVNGFSSYPLRDAFLTANSTKDILILRQEGGAGSGTAANLYRRQFGDVTAREIIKLIRQNSMPFQEKTTAGK